MIRTALAAALSLIVATGAFAQEAAKPAAPPQTIVQKVRAAIAQNDFAGAEKLVLDDMAAHGTTPIAVEAFSWLGRGAVAAKDYGAAMTYAARTYEIVEEQLKTRKLDDEARLPIALGAAIEVTALATAGQGGRSDAVLYLRRELDTYKGTSIVERLNKNVNLLSLEGSPAFPVDSPKWIGAAPPAMASLKGKPVILYLWAHWCPDCKAQGPVLEALLEKYKSTGLTLVAPTKFYGYVAKRQPAGPDEELTYLTGVRDSDYPWMKNIPVPISEQIFAQYGVSTTPTLVLIDRAGNVSRYNPGQLTAEQLEPLIQKIIVPAATASQD
ncbi:MAG: TlpA family protein disulfide reductase [Vicinamibacterales bacterium]